MYASTAIMPAALVGETNDRVGTTVTNDPGVEGQLRARQGKEPAHPSDPASMTRPDLRAPMAAGIATRARISAISTAIPADLSGMSAKSGPQGIGVDLDSRHRNPTRIDVTNKSSPMGSV